jgi:23S rRNA (adenine2503-C2)-methyltransferase
MARTKTTTKKTAAKKSTAKKHPAKKTAERRSAPVRTKAKINLKGLWIEELEDLLGDLGEKRYKARQLASWVYARGASDFEQMTDLSKDLRDKLSRIAYIENIKLVNRQISEKDLTEKYLFELSDGEKIETVLMWEGKRVTVCLSTQVGCALGCTFCATGKMGFKRNLTAGEIVDQVINLKEDRITHVVLMGMGEPFQNYEQTLKAIRILNNEMGGSFGAKRITLSTAGIPSMIRKLADENLKIKLAISLNAPTDATRNKLMPVNKKYPLKELIAAVKDYNKKTDRGVTFEYVLIRDANDSEKDALALSNLVKGVQCKINLIPYNPIPDLPYQRPSDERTVSFRDYLYPRSPTVTLRLSKGEDILAACGQLRT